MFTILTPEETTMPTAIEFPAEFIPICDAVIEHVISGSPSPSELSLITKWRLF